MKKKLRGKRKLIVMIFTFILFLFVANDGVFHAIIAYTETIAESCMKNSEDLPGKIILFRFQGALNGRGGLRPPRQLQTPVAFNFYLPGLFSTATFSISSPTTCAIA
jgi:hypothetical protein